MQCSVLKTKKGDYSGRFVPTDILLSMQDNEKSFDSVKDILMTGVLGIIRILKQNSFLKRFINFSLHFYKMMYI